MEFKNFEELIGIVKGKQNRVVVPGANNTEALEAIAKAQKYGLVSGGTLIGPENDIISIAKEKGLNLENFKIVPSTDIQKMCAAAVDAIAKGEGDFLLKGLVDTKFYMKAILNKEKGLIEPGRLISHFLLFEATRYKKLFALSDAAILIKPTLEQKASIIENAVIIMRALGVEKPNVSVVCPIEKVNPKVQSTLDAAELVKWNEEGKIKNAVVEGPYDIYITFSKEKAAEKGITGKKIPGDVDIVLLPDLDSANTVYKSLAFFAEGVKAAAILVGTKIPVILPSRADDAEVKLNSIALCSFLKDKKLT